VAAGSTRPPDPGFRPAYRCPSEAQHRLARDDVPEVPRAARRAVPESPERVEGGTARANWRHRAAPVTTLQRISDAGPLVSNCICGYVLEPLVNGPI